MRRRHLLPLALALSACGSDGSDTSEPSPPATANRAPAFLSGNRAGTNEGTLEIIYRANAPDPDGDLVTYTISGPDAARFTIIETGDGSGQVRFRASPDFEYPTDADDDGIYRIEITASDGRLASTIAVDVTVGSIVGPQYGLRSVGVGLGELTCGDYDRLDRGVLITGTQDGRVWRIGGIAGTPQAKIILDVSADLARPGLLGCQVDAGTGGGTGQSLYLSVVTAAGDMELRRYAVDPGLRPTGQMTVLVRVPGTAGRANRGGGLVAQGNALYAAFGDAGEPDRAQNGSQREGKLLRITNPGAASPVIDTLANGLRDPATIMLVPNGIVIGDRGLDRQELNFLPTERYGQANFGWPYFDGTKAIRTDAPSNLAVPVAEYDRSGGTGGTEEPSITVGLVYPDQRNPVDFDGRIFFGDRNIREIWTLPLTRLVYGRTLPRAAFQRRGFQFKLDRGDCCFSAALLTTPDNPVVLFNGDGSVFVSTF